MEAQWQRQLDAVKEARRLAADAEEGKEMKEETCIEGVELAGPSSEGAAAAEASVDIAAPFSAAIAMEETAGNEGQLAGHRFFDSSCFLWIVAFEWATPI